MRRIKFLSLALMLWVVGCEKAEVIEKRNYSLNAEYEITKVDTMDATKFLDDSAEELYDEYSKEEINKVLSDNKLPFKIEDIVGIIYTKKKKYCVSEFSCLNVYYNYHSIDQYGKDVLLSSALFVPYETVSNRKLSPQFIHIDCHGTNAKNTQCPTNDGSLMWPIGVEGGVVVSPDYQGLGVSVDSTQLYLCEKLCARQALDAARAALVLLKKEFKIELDTGYYTQVSGYSQGGAMAVAIAHAIETMSDEEKRTFDFRLKRTFCGGGPYDPQTTMEKFFEWDTIYYPFGMLMTLKGMIAGEPDLFEGITCKDYYSDAMYNSDVDSFVDSKDCGPGYIKDAINTFCGRSTKNELAPCSKIFKSNLLDSTTEEYQRLMIPLQEAFKRNNICAWGWVPQHPIYMIHATNDEYVPVENFDLAVKTWNSSGNLYGCKIKMPDLDGEHYHPLLGMIFYVAVMTDIYPLICVFL